MVIFVLCALFICIKGVALDIALVCCDVPKSYCIERHLVLYDVPKSYCIERHFVLYWYVVMCLRVIV